jgi:superoxide reductase
MRFCDLVYGKESKEVEEKMNNHIPRIECPDVVKAGEEFEVRVYVQDHPSRLDHSIRYIEVYLYEEGRSFNPVKLAKALFTPEYTNPDVRFKLKLRGSGIIFALSYCNLHGLWENGKEVRVE